MTTPIFDIAHQCLAAFNRAVAEHDESLLEHRVALGDAPEISDKQKQNRSSADFLGIHNGFLHWIGHSGALSLDSSLDAKLHGLSDVSAMVIELLEMVLRNLHRSKFT